MARRYPSLPLTLDVLDIAQADLDVAEEKMRLERQAIACTSAPATTEPYPPWPRALAPGRH